ncbi:MAG: class I tRNA ligase family protein, partial [Lachnospiraceae bacterium]|nr:class I tRNA ligase family protein [Lachnospiraceae bacterium]
GNVVDPMDIVKQYGADTLRLYVLFMGDYGAATPWSENGVKGCKRFIDRFATLPEMVDKKPGDTSLESSLHKMIKKVTEDIEQMKFNTAIAAMMTFMNEVSANGSITKDELLVFLKLLSPFAPHICEEIWEGLGQEGFVTVSGWPSYDEAKTVDQTIEIAVQINGKLRATVMVDKDISKEDAIAKGKEAVADKLTGNIVKEIYVPGRIVNIVMK